MSFRPRALAISKDEFRKMFRRCAPPRMGWSHNIGVANSGGPDSTCLLFLIHRHLSEQTLLGSPQSLPRKVVSLTIDHDLQASSSTMAEQCAKVAHSIGVEHLTSQIPWSEPPYPSLPTSDQYFESIARTARYHSLLQAMRKLDIGVLAFGHHADDQVETSLMRLGRGTTELGAGGMRFCRRWGMGMGKHEDTLGWAGYDGMNKWIVRPLLEVSKDRILATCEANNLEYVTDKTNFQPNLTLRNALRHRIQGNNGKSQEEQLPPDIAEKMIAIERGVSSLNSVSMTLDSGADELRSLVRVLTTNLEDIDSQVDSALKRCSLSSFPGTFLISARGLSSIKDEAIRKAMVLRIMRYASFHPWGSARADGNRRKSSISQIVEKLWSPNFIQSRLFVAGGGVLWTPVVVRGDSIKTPDRVLASSIREDETFGWLASRQPPLHRRQQEARGLLNVLEIDVTHKIADAMRQQRLGGPPVVNILYDSRFLVTFDLEKIPDLSAARILYPQSDERIWIYPSTRWYWPKIVWKSEKECAIIHSKIDEKRGAVLLGRQPGTEGDINHWQNEPVSANWIKIEWIRSLDAL